MREIPVCSACGTPSASAPALFDGTARDSDPLSRSEGRPMSRLVRDRGSKAIPQPSKPGPEDHAVPALDARLHEPGVRPGPLGKRSQEDVPGPGVPSEEDEEVPVVVVVIERAPGNARGGTSMCEAHGRDVSQGPSGRPQAAEEIPVLVIRKEGLVEEADLLERPPADEKGGARDRQETVRVLLPVERDNRGVIVVDDPGTDGRNAIIAF